MEVRGDDGEVVAPEPVVFITLACSGVCLPIAERILFPFIPVDGGKAFKQELSKTEGKVDNSTQSVADIQKNMTNTQLQEAEGIH